VAQAVEVKKLKVDVARASGTFQCTICCANDVDTVLVPCGHLICGPCARHALAQRGECPFDRQRVQQLCPFFKP
jgi:hypothetical protein